MNVIRCFALTACACMVLLSCSGDDSTLAGNGSELPNAAIGTLVYPDGTPAAGADVRIYVSQADPRSLEVSAEATTGVDGRYVVTGLTPGSYNVLGMTSGARSFRKDANIAAVDTTYLPTDTLYATGSVCGVVKLVGDVDTAQIYLLVLGTQTYTAAGADGRFCLNEMAAGTYVTRIVTTVHGYGPKDTILQVRAGVTTNLDDTVLINSSVLPVPTGLRYRYDTLKQIVYLSWNDLMAETVKGYYVFRKHPDSLPAKLNRLTITDTSTWMST